MSRPSRVIVGVQLEVTRRNAAISEVADAAWVNFTTAAAGMDAQLATKADNAALAAQVLGGSMGKDRCG